MENEELTKEVYRLSALIEKNKEVQNERFRWLLIVGALLMGFMGYATFFEIPNKVDSIITPKTKSSIDSYMSRLHADNSEANTIMARLRSAGIPGPLKICTAVAEPHRWRMTVVVPQNWTKGDCSSLKAFAGAEYASFGCIRTDGKIAENDSSCWKH